MATFPLPFIPNAPEGNNIVDAPPAVPATTDQFANTQFSTSFRPQEINTSVEVQPDYYNAQFENEIDFTNTGSDPYANTPYAKNFRAPDANQEPNYDQPDYYYLNNEIDIQNTNTSDPYANTPYSINVRAPDANQEPFPEQPDYTYNPENFSGDPNTGNPPTTAGVQETRTSGSNQNGSVELDRVNITGVSVPDSRIRLHLAPGAKYLYNAENPGILAPLKRTGGVIFPYTPTINATYSAAYDTPDLTHSNYKFYNYKNSSVSDIQIQGKFTAQDQKEAEYLLAVIHFFRSATKMFYGLDSDPIKGTPPPLCFLTGYGTYMFDNHPLVISNFTLNLPADVDYIDAGSMTGGDAGFTPYNPPVSRQGSSFYRLRSAGLNPGATPSPPSFSQIDENSVNTRVPTILDISITCHPIITRKDMSNKFSLEKYATGELLRASSNGIGRGVW